MKQLVQLTAFTLLFCITLKADTITGKVVKVSDGDTITILDSEKTEHKIRLLYIDAPEAKQAFGQKSKEHLSTLCFGKTVKVEWTEKDRYNRILGVVTVDKTNCNEEMLKKGFAWHYRAYSKDEALQALEDNAKKEKLGLWIDKEPIPPWDFRKKK